MKRFLLFLPGVCLAVTAFAQTNLLTVNPGFETAPNLYLGGVGTFGGIAGWLVIGNNTGSGPIVGVSTDQPLVTGRDGSAVAYIWNGSFETAAADRPVVTAGNRYLVRLRSESDLVGPADFTLGVRWYGSSLGYTPLATSQQTLRVGNLSAFQTFSLPVTAPTGSTHAAVFAATGSGVGVLLDHVEFLVQPIPPPGTPPSLPSQNNISSPYGVPIQIANTVNYQGLPRVDLTYSLLSPPAGATIDASGVVSWTPTLAQSGTTHTITTRVVDNIDNSLFDENSFQVTVVNPPNNAPLLPEAVRRTVVLGSSLTFTNTATDDNIPAQTLTYQLLSAPPGAAISPSGVISFSPTAFGRYVITTQVTDNGSPALSAINSFVVEVIPALPVGATNLLTNNPGFEAVAFSTFTNGAYSFQGWNGHNPLYNQHAVYDGGGTQGTRHFHQDWGGNLSTAPNARAAAVPGQQFLMLVDLRSLIRNFDFQRLGTRLFIEFFNSSGTLIKQVWGPDWSPQVQSTAAGTGVWETHLVRGVAPAGTASVGVRIYSPSGQFNSNEANYTQDRHVEVDNVRVYVLPENQDRLAYRRAPRLVEPGKTATLKINHATSSPRTLRVALLNSSGVEVTSGTVSVSSGRFRATPMNVAVPGNLPNGTYSWRITLVSTAGGNAVATQDVPNVIVDETISAPTLNGTDFRADNPNIVYMGRIENLANGSRWLHWFGSEVRIRFKGTSLSMIGGINESPFGGFFDHNLRVVVDGDFANPVTVNLPTNGSQSVTTLVSGLSDAVHTVTIIKDQESDRSVRLDAFRVDASRGLLRAEPLSDRRIEIFGDSVTNGGEASPNLFGYAPLVGRELDADVHIIAKGGTGVASSFSGQSTLLKYWDNLTFQNVFYPEGGQKFDLAGWAPDIVVVAIGHNDQFNDGGFIFRPRYADFRAALRSAYGEVPVVSTNTTISNPLFHFENAIAPLTAVDSDWFFLFQHNPSDNLLYGHPDRAGHAAMAYGDTLRFSLADGIEDQAGWGLDFPAKTYEQWVTESFTPSQIALGQHLPDRDSLGQGVTNLLRFALGIPANETLQPGDLPSLDLTTGGHLALTFLRARTDVDYHVESSADLSHWEILAINPGIVGQAVTVTDSSPIERNRFLRLRTTLRQQLMP